MSGVRGARVLAVWCPDWPAVAAAAVADVPPTRAVVVLHANRVVACSAVARAAGVRRGHKRREAQARCPDLFVAQVDSDRDARLFEPVVAAVDATVPGVEVLRPGLVVLAARGAARYFGSEEAAAERLVDAVAAVGVECQIGIADELSTAVIAARRAALVPPGTGADFLAPLSVSELAVEPSLAAPERGELIDLLHRLGLRRIGDFAALTPGEVASRFGADAIRAHRCARAEPERPPSAAPPPPDLAVEYPCDPPIDRVDAAAFAGRLLATRLHDRLSAAAVACTRLTVVAETAAGEHLSRTWRCAEPLTPTGTADRIRWQLDGWLTHRAPTETEDGGTIFGAGDSRDSIGYTVPRGQRDETASGAGRTYNSNGRAVPDSRDRRDGTVSGVDRTHGSNGRAVSDSRDRHDGTVSGADRIHGSSDRVVPDSRDQRDGTVSGAGRTHGSNGRAVPDSRDRRDGTVSGAGRTHGSNGRAVPDSRDRRDGTVSEAGRTQGSSDRVVPDSGTRHDGTVFGAGEAGGSAISGPGDRRGGYVAPGVGDARAGAVGFGESGSSGRTGAGHEGFTTGTAGFTAGGRRPSKGAGPSAPITMLRLEPVEVVAAGALQLGLWGGVGEGEERARRALIRVQGLLGGEAVLIGVLSGGRGPAERVTLIALGDEPVPAADPALPWPGRLPRPAPAMVLVNRPEVALEDSGGAPVWISDRGLLTADPARLRWGSRELAVTDWSGPWLLDERWWSGDRTGNHAVRAQVMLNDTEVRALLLLGYDRAWHVEGLYD
ncbi:DNA polymerase Y family protein [Nocardia terpenica]|uniref:Y-family DNA polymerase n=1 Tax=Nocardia terpenica TaxID=455432 RepID=UPI001EEC7336|nr:DNA polymerase Y family protein [Nocardia terpenica]